MSSKIAFIDRWLSRGAGLLPRRNDGQHGPLDGWSGKIADACTDRERLIDADTSEYQVVIPPSWCVIDVDIKNCETEEQRVAAERLVSRMAAQTGRFEAYRSKSGGYHVWAMVDRNLPKRMLYGGRCIEVFGPGHAVTEAVPGSGLRERVGESVAGAAAVPYELAEAWIAAAGFDRSGADGTPLVDLASVTYATEEDVAEVRRAKYRSRAGREAVDALLSWMDKKRPAMFGQHLDNDAFFDWLAALQKDKTLKGKDLGPVLWSRLDAIRSDLPSWSGMTQPQLLSVTRRVAAYALSRQQEKAGASGPSDAETLESFLAEHGLYDSPRNLRGDLLLSEPDERGHMSWPWRKYLISLLDGKVPRHEIPGYANLLSAMTERFFPTRCNTDRDRICVAGGKVIDLSENPETDATSYWDRQVAVAPAPGPCPTWEWFLVDRFEHPEEREAVERVLGWLFTGRHDLQLAVLFCGGSGSGKSVITNLVAALAGPYAWGLSADDFARGARSHQGKWVAGAGSRICVVHELQDVRANWEMVKAWVSGEWSVRDRAAYSSTEVDYKMQAKLVITANGMPDTAGHAKAVARRLLYIPMERPVAHEDPALGAKLLAEGPQILHRLVAAARRWYADGADQRALRIPESWAEGKEAAMAVSDPLHEWTVNNLVYSEASADHISTEAIWNRFKAFNPGVYADIRDFGRALRGAVPSGARPLRFREPNKRLVSGYRNIRWSEIGSANALSSN